MKGILILFLAVYFLAEVSARPESQATDKAQELLDGVKTTMQEVWTQAQNKTTEVINRARDFFRNTFGSSQQILEQNDISTAGKKLIQMDEKAEQN